MTMYILFTILVLIYYSIHSDAHDIEILSSGLGNINERDMLMVFYVTLRHHGAIAQRVMLTMVECCEMMEGEADCDFMDLYGSTGERIDPGTSKNLSLYYPNLYPYNRKGWCLVNVIHHSPSRRDVTTLRHRINFDTTVSSCQPPTSQARGKGAASQAMRCDTPDLDPFDNCNPVSCPIKYSGFRNYYNRKWKKCQRVPLCMSSKMKDMPDIVYVPTINICRNVAAAVTEDDINQILRGVSEPNNLDDQVVNIRCHHGEIDPQTGLCICDYGWRSEPFDPDLYNPHSVYSMCNIRCTQAAKTRSAPRIVYHLIGVFVALWFASCIVCFESWGFYSCLKRKAQQRRPPSRHCEMYCTVREEEVEEEINSCQYSGFREVPSPRPTETICNVCLEQCPRTLECDCMSKSMDGRSLWDIAR